MGFLHWNEPISTRRAVIAALFSLIISFGAVLRFHGLGERSLWGDEFCTWKVAEMPLGESLRWQPELTKPPLYQFTVRAVGAMLGQNPSLDFSLSQPSPRPSSEGRGGAAQDALKVVPSEWHLRLPAAICGALAVAAMWWLGALAGGWTVGAAGALLLAVNELQLEYSQEARPYSMLMLGSMLSTGIWYRIVARQRGSKATRQGETGNKATRQQGNEKIPEVRNSKFEVRKTWWLAVAYVVVTALSLHANYLIVLTVTAHALWAALFLSSIANRQSQFDNANVKVAAGAILMTALACVPMVWHFLRHRTSVFQGLDWIAAPTVETAIKVLSEITFGPVWVWALLLTALSVLVIVACMQRRRGGAADCRRLPQIMSVAAGEADPCWLLLLWLVAAWGGLLVISWIAHPAMVARYALPVAAPAILLPLVVLNRLDRRLPLLVAGLFVVGTAPAWTGRIDRVKPGFREMVAFLDEYADPQREAVVAVIERTTSPGWEEMDLLGFEYYRSAKFEIRSLEERPGATKPRSDGGGGKQAIEVLYLRNGRADGDQPILRDPQAIWLVTFLADPMEALESAGRRVEQIEIGDKVFDQLYFEPYRLIRVAAME